MAEDNGAHANIAASTHEEGHFTNPRGYKIFTQSWVPANPVATLVLVHGLAEHSSRYFPFVNYLLGRHIAIYTLDHESHGKSEGEKEYVEKVQHMIDDVVRAAREAHAKHEGLPRLLFGHSLGGCIALSVCIQQPDLFEYAVFSAPTTSKPPSVNAFLKAMGGMVASIGPKWRLTPLDKSTLSRNPQNLQAYFADPLIWTMNIAAGFGYDILSVGDHLIEKSPQFTTPSLFLSGSADRVVSPDGSFKFFNTCSSQDKTYVNLEGWYHELLNEEDGHLLFPFIADWLHARLSLQPGSIRATNEYLSGGSTPGDLQLRRIDRAA